MKLGISGQPGRLVRANIAGNKELVGIESRIELGTGTGHCYGRQPTGCGVLDESYIFG
jgi:hypothetical protein